MFLTYELRVRMMALSCSSVSHHSREKRLDGTEDGDRERRGNKTLNCLIVELRGYRLRHRKAVGEFREFGSDCGELHSSELAEKNRCQCTDDEGDERARNLLGHLAPAEAYDKAYDTHDKFHPVDAAHILEITDPLRNESRRYLKVKRKSEEILHLRREDRQGDTASESDYYRIRDEFEYDTHLAHTHDNEEDTRHDGRDDEALHAVLADDAGHDHDKRSGRTSDKEVGSSEERNEETGYDRRYETLLRGHSACYTERYRKWQRDDSHDDTGNKIRCECLAVILSFSEQPEKLGLEHVFKVKVHNY